VVRWTPKTTMTLTPEPMDKLDAAAMAAVSGPADDPFSVERNVEPRVIRPSGPARAGCGGIPRNRFLGGPSAERRWAYPTHAGASTRLLLDAPSRRKRKPATAADSGPRRPQIRTRETGSGTPAGMTVDSRAERL
jgi:hypothetical protein